MFACNIETFWQKESLKFKSINLIIYAWTFNEHELKALQNPPKCDQSKSQRESISAFHENSTSFAIKIYTPNKNKVQCTFNQLCLAAGTD